MFLGYEMLDKPIGNVIPMPLQPTDESDPLKQPVGSYEAYPPNPKWIPPR